MLETTPFLNTGIQEETGPPHQNALAHFSSHEFTVWGFFFFLSFLFLMLLLCLSDVFFISWAKQLRWETWTREIHSLRTSDDGQTFISPL